MTASSVHPYLQWRDPLLSDITDCFAIDFYSDLSGTSREGVVASNLSIGEISRDLGQSVALFQG